jgi:hypothetical protein
MKIPEDGGTMFLRNVGIYLQVLTALQSLRITSTHIIKRFIHVFFSKYHQRYQIIKTGKARHVARMEKIRNEQNMLVGSTERNILVERRGWENNIKIELKKIGCESVN